MLAALHAAIWRGLHTVHPHSGPRRGGAPPGGTDQPVEDRAAASPRGPRRGGPAEDREARAGAANQGCELRLQSAGKGVSPVESGAAHPPTVLTALSVARTYCEYSSNLI